MANFYNRFLESVGQWPDRVAVEVQHPDPALPLDRYTFTEMRLLSDGVARYLERTLPGQPTHCALLAGNGPRWMAAFLGTLANGKVVVPLDTALKDAQVRKLLLASDSSVLFVDSTHRQTAERATKGLAVRLVPLDDAELQPGPLELPNFAPSEMDPQDVAAILYSSGTTGDPKGVMLTHDNFLAEVNSLLELFSVGPSDSILGILPLFHAFALVVNLLLPMAAGARMLFLETLNTADLMRALPSVNIFACVPQFFYLIHDRLWKEVNARGKLAAAVFRLMLAASSAGRTIGLNLGKVFFGRIHTLFGRDMRYLATAALVSTLPSVVSLRL